MDADRKVVVEEYRGSSLCILCGTPGSWIVKSTRAREKTGTYRVNHLCPACYNALLDYFKEARRDDRDKHNEDQEEAERLDL